MELWKRLKPDQLKKLIEYQKKTYGTKLNFKDIESSAELEKIMRQPPQKPKGIK